MLVEFRVKNFRSLRDEQVLSLVASKDRTLQDTHTLATGLKAAPALLRSAAIFGANASGKSNVIKALQYMRGVVIESATVIQPGQEGQLGTVGLGPLRTVALIDPVPGVSVRRLRTDAATLAAKRPT